MSAYYFDEDKVFGGDDVILTGGYDAVLAPLAAGLDIRLQHPVNRIVYRKGDGATVYAGGKTFEADFVICTCPLGVLQAGGIAFDPPLPKKVRRRIRRIGMGSVCKIALKFDAPHWPAETQYFGHMSKEKGRWNYFMNYRTFSNQNILVGFSVGAASAKVEALSDQAMIADAMKAVRTMFGDDVPDPAAYRITRWSQEPYSRGAYSFAKVGSSPVDFDKLAQPVAETLLFAGEHTDFAYHGTVHGAYLSGIRAARLIDDELSE